MQGIIDALVHHPDSTCLVIMRIKVFLFPSQRQMFNLLLLVHNVEASDHLAMNENHKVTCCKVVIVDETSSLGIFGIVSSDIHSNLEIHLDSVSLANVVVSHRDLNHQSILASEVFEVNVSIEVIFNYFIPQTLNGFISGRLHDFKLSSHLGSLTFFFRIKFKDLGEELLELLSIINLLNETNDLTSLNDPEFMDFLDLLRLFFLVVTFVLDVLFPLHAIRVT